MFDVDGPTFARNYLNRAAYKYPSALREQTRKPTIATDTFVAMESGV